MANRKGVLMNLLECEGQHLHAVLVRLVLREDVAEDLMQELFIKLMRSDGFFEAANRVGYAYRTAITLASNWRRSQQRRRDRADWPDDAPAANTSPLSQAIQTEQIERILDGLCYLPDVSREVVVMRYIQQKPYAEIGEQIGRDAHQARAICHKAVRQLRRRLVESHARVEEKRHDRSPGS